MDREPVKPPTTKKRAQVRAGGTPSISKAERTKQLGAGRAAEIFLARTGIDPRIDSIVVRAAVVSVSAELIEQVRDLTSWFEPARKAVRVAPPAPPDWLGPALRASSPTGSPSAGKVLVSFGTAACIAPGKEVDLVQLSARVASFRAQVLEVVALGRELGDDLQQTWAELTRQQSVGGGRQGAFRAPRKRGTQRDEARWRFLSSVCRLWAGARRAALQPTEVGLLAVHLGLDDGRGGLDGVVKRWSQMMQQAKRGTAP